LSNATALFVQAKAFLFKGSEKFLPQSTRLIATSAASDRFSSIRSLPMHGIDALCSHSAL
jgi:hypothetical protein